MPKFIKSLAFIIVATLSSWFGYAHIVDPAIILSRSTLNKDNIISEIENNKSEKIYLKAGNDKFGFIHILKKHSANFFDEAEQKGNLFPSGTTGKQIIKGIETVYKNGKPATNSRGNKTVRQHELKLNGKTNNYRLIINDENDIITFYRLKKKN